MRLTDNGLYLLACTGLMLAVLVLCLLAVGTGCSGPQTAEPQEPQAEGTVELAATVDLGLAVVDLQADATVAPPVEVSVCAAATVQALAVLRVEVTLAWEILPAPATWHLCVEAFGLRRCIDG